MIITVSTSFCRVHLTAAACKYCCSTHDGRTITFDGYRASPVSYRKLPHGPDVTSTTPGLRLGCSENGQISFSTRRFFSFWTKIEQTGFLLLK